MSTPEQRAEWRRLEQAATPGGWTHKLDPAWNNKDRIIENPEGFVIIRDENCHAHFKLGRDEANYDFIAAARTAVPALLADVERLEAEKHRRIYYQDIVYAVCNAIDALRGSHVGSGIVCGSADEPTREVQDAVYALVAENARLRTQSDGRVKMYTWWKPAWFLAVAQARSVSEARQLLLKGELGDSGDGSCPERDRARQLILEETPSMWIGANAEFMLNVNAELREQEDYSEKLFRENAQLRAELREALLEIAQCGRKKENR